VPAFLSLSCLALCFGLLRACGVESLTSAQTGEQTEAGERTRPPPVAEPEEPETDVEPEPAPPLRRRPPRIHSRLSPSTVAHLRAIAATADLRDDVFAKMGGSSIESFAYLHCFASDRHLDLGGREELRPTIEFFRGGRADRRHNPFRRRSLAAHKGWSLRHGLTGRPTRIVRELRATRARYALLLFGGNDVQARNPRRFGTQLEKTVETLVHRGVVPVLGSTSPRGDDPAMDLWARRYNRISRGIARAWDLPYINFYLALEALPRHGLARDGVHSNVLLDGGRGRPCVFTEEGLQRGMNVRNLRTLESLHRLRSVLGGQAAPDPEPERPTGEGTAASPLHVASAPFAERRGAADLSASLDGYSCEGSASADGPERVYRVLLGEPTTLWLSTLARRGTARVYVLGAELDPASCVASGEELEIELGPGVHHIVAELQPEGDGASLTFMLDYPVQPPP